MIDIVVAPPYLTVQDLGRPGYRSQGVPVGGAMDPWAISEANVLVGNPPGAAGLEWALGGWTIRFLRPTAFALTGTDVAPALDGASIGMRSTHRAPTGSTLMLQRPVTGRFAYLAFEGGIDVPIVLGSRSTYLAAGFGGFEGRTLRSGDRLMLRVTSAAVPRAGFGVAPEVPPPSQTHACRILPGPNPKLFPKESAAWRALVSAPFRVDRSSDRTGYRLSGPLLEAGELGTLPSEPMCPGAMQVATGGQPIVLMPDGPTVGGYPVIAVVCSADLGALAQRQPGDEVRFVELSLDDAYRSVRRLDAGLDALNRLGPGGGS